MWLDNKEDCFAGAHSYKAALSLTGAGLLVGIATAYKLLVLPYIVSPKDPCARLDALAPALSHGLRTVVVLLLLFPNNVGL